ncbi:MAG: NAD-dependent epimerase/dehydratase family protein [Planctomycetota bacterium]
MKVLITGICGFVGSSLARSLIESGVASHVVGIDNLSRRGSETNASRMQAMGVQLVRGDIRHQSDVASLPPCDWLIDAAANPSVLAGFDGGSTSLQTVEHNAMGTVYLLEYCKRHQAGMTLLSTSRVYSIAALRSLRLKIQDNAFIIDESQRFPRGFSPLGISEDFSTIPPLSLYGSTKLASEFLALEYGESFGFPVWINRCGVLAGPGQFGNPTQGIIAHWIHRFREKRPLRYMGFGATGFQVRDCLHPSDLAKLVLLQMQTDSTSQGQVSETHHARVFNVAGGAKNAISLSQLTAWCVQRFPDSLASVKLPDPAVTLGRDQDLDAVLSAERPFDLPHVILDSRRAASTWGWQPQFTTTEILDAIAAFAEEHPDWIRCCG